MRLIEQTGIPHGNYVSGSYISPFSFASWVNRYSDWAFFFGADTVAEAIVVPEEIRAKIPTDFGRSKGIAGIISVPLVLCSGRRRRDATGRKRRRSPARVASLRPSACRRRGG